MLYGKIDVDLVISGLFAQLSKATRDVLHVISALANFRTGEFYHTQAYIAKLAGCSTRTVRRSFNELLHPPWLPHNHEALGMPGIISVFRIRPGRPTVYRYNFLSSGEDRGGYSTHDPRPEYDHNFLYPSEYSTTNDESQMSGEMDTNDQTPRPPMSTKQQYNNQDLFTTTAASKIPRSLIEKMRVVYGDIVDDVVVAMSSMNGEVINPAGYFIACCKNGWVPVSKRIIEKNKLEFKQEVQDRRAADDRKRQQRWEIEFQRCDPDLVERELKKIRDILGG